MYISPVWLLLSAALWGGGTMNATAESSTVSSPTAQSCIKQYFDNMTTTKCFWITETKTNYSEADKRCRLDGGVLATIQDAEQADFIFTNFYTVSSPSTIYWIGMACNNSKWTSLNGDSLKWEQPCPTSPSNECSVMRKQKSPPLIQHSCTRNRTALCKNKTAQRADCEDQAMGFEVTEKCFWTTNTKTNYTEANDMCEANGGYLATISDDDHARFVYRIFFPEHSYFWVKKVCDDGTSSPTSNWLQPCFTVQFNDCGMLSFPVPMDHEPCSLLYAALCEINEKFILDCCGDNGLPGSTRCPQTFILQKPATVNITISKTITVTATPPCTDAARTATGEISQNTPSDPVITSTVITSTVITSTVITSTVITSTALETLHDTPTESAITSTVLTVLSPTITVTSTHVAYSTEGCATATLDLAPGDLKMKIEQIEAELTVKKKELSSTKRRLQSAPDARTSSVSIGVFSLVFVLGCFLLPVVVDIPRYYHDIRQGAARKEKVSSPRSVTIYPQK